MAIIGFIVVVSLGIYCLLVAYGAILNPSFSSKTDWLLPVVAAGAGVALLYWAFTLAPFSIVMGGA